MPKEDLVFKKPICNAPGILGFSPSPQRMPYLDQFGAFFTNPISLHPRRPASIRGVVHNTDGIWLHSGFPNPGLRSVLRKHAARWERSPIPVIPHLMADATAPLDLFLRLLEDISTLMAVEISFPPEWTDSDIVLYLPKKSFDLPLILSLAPARLPAFCENYSSLPVVAFSMAARREIDSSEDANTIRGRNYGRALFPKTLRLVEDLSQRGIPLIASGGIYEPEQVAQCLQAGAIAVQLDTILWVVGNQSWLFTTTVPE